MGITFCRFFTPSRKVISLFFTKLLASMAWTNPDVKGKKPTCRHGHVMVAVGNKIYLHGGMARETFFNDMHEFDTSKFVQL